jgi:hypothetical protein
VSTLTEREFFDREGFAPANSELGRAEDRLRLARQHREFAARGLGSEQGPVQQRGLQFDVERAEESVDHHRRRLGVETGRSKG